MLNKEDYINVIENTVARLVNEGVMDIDNSEYDSKFITDNDNVILQVLDKICSKYSHYVTSEIDGNTAYADFGDVYVIVNIDDSGFIYVSEVKGSVLDDKEKSSELWKEVCTCIVRINGFNKRLTDLKMEEEEINNAFEGKIREGQDLNKNNQNYSHFAVNKSTNKIVNGWDYHDYDSDELKQFKYDYFTVDMIDYGFDPKQYKIYTDKYLRRNGIDPDDNNNWANS